MCSPAIRSTRPMWPAYPRAPLASPHWNGCPFLKVSIGLDMREMGSPLTMKDPGTANSCSPSNWPHAWSRTGNIWSSWRTEAMTTPSCGYRRVGPRRGLKRKAPLYWEKRDGHWWVMTLNGLREVDKAEPVCHVSYFEADAFARWADARLPTEAEWEVAAQGVPVEGNFVESGLYHPAPLNTSTTGGKLAQMYGDVWQWTQSSYAPYPNFKPGAGAVGEYNGKFMCNQYVLHGGSCATSLSHI